MFQSKRRETNDYKHLNIILEEIKYSACYKMNKKMRFYIWPAAGWMKKISPGRSGGNTVIFFRPN